jgi:Kelch motif
MPTCRKYFASATLKGRIYAIGGHCGAYLASVDAYDPETNIWTSKAPMLTQREGLAVGAVRGVLYAVGGDHSRAPALNTVEAFTL